VIGVVVLCFTFCVDVASRRKEEVNIMLLVFLHTSVAVIINLYDESTFDYL